MVKKLVFSLATIGITLAILEAFSFVTVQLVDKEDFFDHRQSVIARLNDKDLTNFSATGGDPVLGWHSYGPHVRQEANCLQKLIDYSHDDAGARLHSRFAPETTEIIIVGDSYTNGDEVSDDETYPARLSDILGVSVANHGVGGYGPTQSLLNLKEHVSRYPQAKVVILGIMYENLFRMVNSYRPVLYSTSSNYSLKPYMMGGEIIPHPGSDSLADINQFKVAANRAFDNDFWAKPLAQFPYLISLGKSLTTNYFWYRKLQKQFRKLGVPEYFLIFESSEIQANMISLLNQYANFSRDHNFKPVAVFIPRNSYDISSASKFINRHRSKISPDLLLGDVGTHPNVDWTDFNLREDDGNNTCHPSPYGYQAIAEYIADLLHANGAWPETPTVR